MFVCLKQTSTANAVVNVASGYRASWLRNSLSATLAAGGGEAANYRSDGDDVCNCRLRAGEVAPDSSANLATAIATNANAIIVSKAAGEYVETRTLKVLTPRHRPPGQLHLPRRTDRPRQKSGFVMIGGEWSRNARPETIGESRHRHEDISAFTAVIGPKFDLAELPATAKLIAKIDNDHIAGQRRQGVFPSPLPCGFLSIAGGLSALLMRRRCEEAGRPAPRDRLPAAARPWAIPSRPCWRR